MRGRVEWDNIRNQRGSEQTTRLAPTPIILFNAIAEIRFLYISAFPSTSHSSYHYLIPNYSHKAVTGEFVHHWSLFVSFLFFIFPFFGLAVVLTNLCLHVGFRSYRNIGKWVISFNHNLLISYLFILDAYVVSKLLEFGLRKERDLKD